MVTGARRIDAIIVGGGPAGSACARSLMQAGMSVAVLDREAFPRMKLCAGWVTPDVLRALDLDPGDYPHSLLTFDRLIIHVKGLSFPLRTMQHSIRRFEFDEFLLRRSGAPAVRHTVKHIEYTGGRFELDGIWCCEYLLGAGGTRCPVYRTLFRERNPRASELQVVALEQEFRYEWQDPRCHLWFFDDGLPGYSWYVPKANGWLNCGIGAMADRLRRRGENIQCHWARFASTLERAELVRGIALAPEGYSYYLRGNVEVIRTGNAFIIGDSAGLATLDFGEGIGPAVYSGLAAANVVTGRGDYSLSGIAATSVDQMIQGGLLRKVARSLLARHFAAAMPQRAAA